MTRRHGGKTWIAPKVLILEDVRFLTVVVRYLPARPESLIPSRYIGEKFGRRHWKEYHYHVLWPHNCAGHVRYQDIGG